MDTPNADEAAYNTEAALPTPEPEGAPELLAPWVSEEEATTLLRGALLLALNSTEPGADDDIHATIADVTAGYSDQMTVTLSTGQRFELTIVQVSPA